VFPGVDIRGGICYFLWNRDNPGKCHVSTHFKDWPVSSDNRQLLEEGADVFIRFNEAVPILNKIVSTERGADKCQSLALPENKRFDKLVSSARAFGLRTFFKGNTVKHNDDVLVYQNGGTGYTPRSSITVGNNLIDSWKVFISSAYGAGSDPMPSRVLGRSFVGEPGSVSTETYLCIGPLGSEIEADSVSSYLACRLTRFLILLHKPSQHATRKVYTFVPTQDWTRPWTDADLYAKYDLTDEEIAFIEKIVRPMDLTSGLSDEINVDEADDE
jgi:site-specific DNA-methyltransferase (adenine-specific)